MKTILWISGGCALGIVLLIIPFILFQQRPKTIGGDFKKVGTLSSPVNSAEVWNYVSDTQNCIIILNVQAMAGANGRPVPATASMSLACK